jgi:hypothetical protein
MMVLNDRFGGGVFDVGQAYAFKLYNVALSDAQIWEESVRVVPRGPVGSLDSFLPLYTASGADEGGLGRNWTITGTLGTVASQPAISRGGGTRPRVFLPLPPGAIAGTIAASLPGLTAALAGQVTDNVAIAATLPGLSAALSGQVTDPLAVAATLPGLTAAVQGAVTESVAIAATLPGLVAAVRLLDAGGSPPHVRRPVHPRGRGTGRRLGVA